MTPWEEKQKLFLLLKGFYNTHKKFGIVNSFLKHRKAEVSISYYNENLINNILFYEKGTKEGFFYSLEKLPEVLKKFGIKNFDLRGIKKISYYYYVQPEDSNAFYKLFNLKNLSLSYALNHYKQALNDYENIKWVKNVITVYFDIPPENNTFYIHELAISLLFTKESFL